MNEAEVFILADQALEHVVEQIKTDQWDMVMPPEFATREESKTITLQKVINYHAYDEAWVPDTLAGKTIAEVGNTYDDDLLDDDPAGNYSRITAATQRVVKNFTDFDKQVHLSYGDFSAAEYLQHIIYFRALRAHDIAKVIGIDANLSPELVQAIWDILGPNAEYWRKMGVFGPEVEISDDAPLQDRLLALTGRQPN